MKLIIFLLVIVFPFSAISLEMESIDVSGYSFVTQGDNQCVPTSFLYMLKIGRSPISNIYESLPGATDSEKLEQLVSQGLNTISSGDGKPFFSQTIGTGHESFQEWFDKIEKNSGFDYSLYKTEMLERKIGEKDPGDFLSRIHNKLIKSLENDLPVMLAVELRVDDHIANISNFEYDHAVVVVGVQREIHEFEMGFTVQYLDPNSGRLFTAFIYEELNDPFDAYLYDSPVDISSTWSQSSSRRVKNSRGAQISSPYLRIAAPSLGGGVSLGWKQSKDMFIDVMVRFNYEMFNFVL